MSVIVYIIIIGLVFLISAGGYFFFPTLMAPKNLAEIEKLIEDKRFKEAQPKLIAFLERDERNVNAHFMLAVCYHRMSQFSDAVVEYRQALKFHKPETELSENLIRKRLARCYRDMGNANEAKNEYLILTTKEPDNYENYFEVGRLFLEAGHTERSVNFFNKAVMANGKHAESWALLGQSQFQTKAYKDAKNSLLKSLQIKPDQKLPRYYLGLSLRYTGDLEWAVKELEMASKESSIKDKAMLALGLVYYDMGDNQKAINEFQKGIQCATPGSSTVLEMRYLLAQVAEKMKSIELAIENWEIIEKIKPNYRDVNQKLTQYSEFRTHDSIKDFVIAGSDQFHNICKKIAEDLGFNIINSSLSNDNTFNALAIDDGQGKSLKKQHTLIMIIREIRALTEVQIRDFHERMKENHAYRGVVMTVGEITPAAMEFASNRPIDIYDSNRIAKLAEKAMVMK